MYLIFECASLFFNKVIVKHACIIAGAAFCFIIQFIVVIFYHPISTRRDHRYTKSKRL